MLPTYLFIGMFFLLLSLYYFSQATSENFTGYLDYSLPSTIKKQVNHPSVWKETKSKISTNLTCSNQTNSSTKPINSPPPTRSLSSDTPDYPFINEIIADDNNTSHQNSTTPPSTQPPTQPTTQPTYPPAQPTYPPAQPTYLPAQPTYLPAQPTYPPIQPTYPPTQPTYPPTQPTYPPIQPTYPSASSQSQPTQLLGVPANLTMCSPNPLTGLQSNSVLVSPSLPVQPSVRSPTGIVYDLPALAQGNDLPLIPTLFRKNTPDSQPSTVFYPQQNELLPSTSSPPPSTVAAFPHMQTPFQQEIAKPVILSSKVEMNQHPLTGLEELRRNMLDNLNKLDALSTPAQTQPNITQINIYDYPSGGNHPDSLSLANSGVTNNLPGQSASRNNVSPPVTIRTNNNGSNRQRTSLQNVEIPTTIRIRDNSDNDFLANQVVSTV